MLESILMYLFSKSQSRIGLIILTIAAVLLMKGKYIEGIGVLLLSTILVAIIQILLGI